MKPVWVIQVEIYLFLIKKLLLQWVVFLVQTLILLQHLVVVEGADHAGLPEGTMLPVALAIAFAEVNALLPVAATPSEDAAGKLLTS